MHDGQATITRATITTCTHSRSCRISARVATRPITSLLGSEGKGKSLLFLTRGIISGEPMEKWCRGFDLENRGIAIVSCSWRHFYKSEVAKNSSFPLCSNVQTFLFDPASKEESFEGTIFQLRSIPLFFKRLTDKIRENSSRENCIVARISRLQYPLLSHHRVITNLRHNTLPGI